MLEGAQLLYKMYWHRKILMRRYKRIKGLSKAKVKRVRKQRPIEFKNIGINFPPRMDFVLLFSFVVVLGTFWFKINHRQQERKQRMVELQIQQEMVQKKIQDWRKLHGYKQKNPRRSKGSYKSKYRCYNLFFGCCSCA